LDGFLRALPDCDVTEIPGADNLFQAEGVIADLQRRYAALYEVRRSYALVNGSSGGILAAVLAAVPRGGKLILARNSHKSVFNALRLGGIRPVYAYPEILGAAREDHHGGLGGERGLAGAILPETVEALLAAHPDASAVILPSPNYYGICSDIRRIAQAVHAAGKTLIVDQAHGAHLKLFRKYGMRSLPESAEEQGADLIICSTHKTLASFTQSAILNVCSERVDDADIEDWLQAVESTSPSYILLATLDANARLLAAHGGTLLREWEENLAYFYRAAAKIDGLRCLRPAETPPGRRLAAADPGVRRPETRAAGKPGAGPEAARAGGWPEAARAGVGPEAARAGVGPTLFDSTKLNLSLAERGLSGAAVEARLIRDFRIYPELCSGDWLMCMTGIGNTRAHYDALIDALREVAGGAGNMFRSGTNANRPDVPSSAAVQEAELFPVPAEKERVPLEEAPGRVCAQAVVPYPPGVPLVCPGERFTAETVRHAKTLREAGEKVIGVDREGKVAVGR
jgi:lysine decarboxylase